MAGVTVVFLMVGGIETVAAASPGDIGAGLDAFHAQRCHLPTNFWSRFEQSGVAVSGAAGFLGILATGAVAAGATVLRVRADATV